MRCMVWEGNEPDGRSAFPDLQTFEFEFGFEVPFVVELAAVEVERWGISEVARLT